MLTVLDKAPSDEERQQSLDACIDLLRCTKDRLWHDPAHVLVRVFAGRQPKPFGAFLVESECGAVALGRAYLFPPLSSGGALVTRP
jgi:hypothetical protein